MQNFRVIGHWSFRSLRSLVIGPRCALGALSAKCTTLPRVHRPTPEPRIPLLDLSNTRERLGLLGLGLQFNSLFVG